MTIRFLLNVWWILVIGLFSTVVFGQTNTATANVKNQPKTENQLLGKWENEIEKIEFFKDGVVTFNCNKVKYSVVGDVIIIESEVVESAKSEEDDINIFKYPFIVKDDSLTLLVKGNKVVYNKPKDADSSKNQAETHVWDGGSNPLDFVGHWCLKSVAENATICLKFYKNRTYEEFNKTMSSDGATIRYRTAGQWSVTANNLTTCEDGEKKSVTYSFEKRNHPQTGAPMLVINGANYVTTDQKIKPW